MPKQKTFKSKSEVWLYPGYAAWHFVSVSKKSSKVIKEAFGKNARGWGSLPVKVEIGKTSWKTSIFPDKKSETYLLPVKKEVRKKEDIQVGDKVDFTIDII